MAAERTLTGRVPREAIRRLEISRLTSALIERYRSLEDLTGTVSDNLDKLGLAGAVPASILAPTLPARRVVGQAVTVRNVARVLSVTRAAARAKARWGSMKRTTSRRRAMSSSLRVCPACPTWADSPRPWLIAQVARAS